MKPPNEYDWYNSGSILVYLYEKSDDKWVLPLEHHYLIEFSHEDRYWGYCECTPNLEGYDARYNCCGNGCDWSAPQVKVQKIENVLFKSFDGNASDLWELEDKWSNNKEEHKREAIEK
ncbi:hypothetical protein [Halalkalibacter oceani]|uniref:hypothetical protein n=1 Tax=Halalkalibacter oceani TaxID=1653776 RepID=UPI00339292C9